MGARWLLVWALAGATTAGCGDDRAAEKPNAPDAGSPDAGGCAAGEATEDDGSCTPAGVPPELCGAGFEPDSAGGCNPILPAEPCAKGQIAVPGDTTCREVMPCGEGTFGDIPVDASTVYVDASATAPGNGSLAQPFTKIQNGIDAAAPGGVVAVGEGTYIEDLYIDQHPVLLWGRCPSKVHVVGASPTGWALSIYEGKVTEVHGLSLSGASGGLYVGASDVLVDRVWFHDSPSFGCVVNKAFGPTKVTGSLFEYITPVAIVAQGATLEVESTAVRDSQPATDGSYGRGLQAQQMDNGTAPAHVTVRGSLFERNTETGLFTEASELTVESSVVRDTLPGLTGNKSKSGISAQYEPIDKMRATLTVRSSVLEHNTLSAAGTDLVVEGVVVRHAREDAGGDARGIVAGAYPGTTARGTLTLTKSLVDDTQGLGVVVLGSDATIERLIVRSTALFPSGTMGQGLLVVYDEASKQRSVATVRASRIEKNHSTGVIALGSDLILESNDISDQLPEDGDGFFGRGLQVQADLEHQVPASVVIRGCAFRRNYETGVIVLGADATIEDTLVEGSLAGSIDGELGDGIAIVSGEKTPASATIRRVILNGSARAGLGTFGATVTLGQSRLECNSIDLHADAFAGFPFELSDEGENTCGCSGKVVPCRVLSAMITPPASAPSPTP